MAQNSQSVLLLRKVRFGIIEICEAIYRQQWSVVVGHWNRMMFETAGLNEISAEYDRIIQEVEECIRKGNVLRLYDLLCDQMDSCVADQLSDITDKERMHLAESFRVENELALQKADERLLEWIRGQYCTPHVSCSYTGTENICIFISEGTQRFQLFSSVNPWREGAMLANQLRGNAYDEIDVLGFGGGHVIRELLRRFPGTKLKIFLPNKELFGMVTNHMAVSDILCRKEVELHADTTCIGFLSELYEKSDKMAKKGFFIDKKELRACLGNTAVVEEILRNLKAERMASFLYVRANEKFGEKIERYIKGLTDHVQEKDFSRIWNKA